MGFTDIFSEFLDSLSVTDLHAEAPPEDDKDEESGGNDEEGKDKEDGGEDGGQEGGDEGGDDEGGDDGGDDEEEEEEEEEEEPEDSKPALEEECSRSAQCQPFRHHYHECAERVQQQQENPDHKGPKEDCVEEFFHLQHCAAQCAAPKLFKQLK